MGLLREQLVEDLGLRGLGGLGFLKLWGQGFRVWGFGVKS